MTKLTTLQIYLSEAAAVPFQWGKHDCCTFIGAWAWHVTGKSPIDRWREAIADPLLMQCTNETMADAILSHAGGIGPLLHKTLTPDGWTPAASFARGDICVVNAPTPSGRKLCAAIFAGHGKWALLTTRGLVVAPVPFLLGWRHPNARAHVYG